MVGYPWKILVPLSISNIGENMMLESTFTTLGPLCTLRNMGIDRTQDNTQYTSPASKPIWLFSRDGRPAPRGRGVPRPAPRCGEGGVPRRAPPRKNDQNRGEVAGQNKGPNLNFLQ